MKKIPLTQGKFAIVDDIDYSFLMQRKWRFNQGYAVRSSRKSEGLNKRIAILMHRVVLSRKLGHSNFEETDHKNQNELDNRRGNLRPSSRLENSANSKSRPGTSKFKGVYWNKLNKKWCAQIKFDGKKKHLGYFTDEVEAAKEYNKAALKYFGEFAYLNPT